MITRAQTRIFGIRLGVDPKIPVIGLMAVAGLLFWYNSRGDQAGSPAPGAPAHSIEPTAGTVSVSTARTRQAGQRRRGIHNDRGTLKLPTVVPANGDIDPILRLDLLDRLAKVELPAANRNLFESGPSEAAMLQAAVPNRVIPLKPVAAIAPPTVVMPGPVTPQLNIPLKYYGFARPSSSAEANRGFFMDGDDILVAAEGQMIKQKYLVVQLTATAAKLEDTQVKMGQSLPVTPEAMEQGGAGFGRQQPGNQTLGQPGMNPGFGGQGNIGNGGEQAEQ